MVGQFINWITFVYASNKLIRGNICGKIYVILGRSNKGHGFLWDILIMFLGFKIELEEKRLKRVNSVT